MLIQSFEGIEPRHKRERKSRAGRNYAPALFAQEEPAKKARASSQNLADAMRRLFTGGKIWNEPCGRLDRGQSRIVLKP
jgi:hypothetical protein